MARRVRAYYATNGFRMEQKGAESMIARLIAIVVLAWALSATAVAAVREEMWRRMFRGGLALAAVSRRRKLAARRYREDLYR